MLRSFLNLLNALVFLGGAAFGVVAAIDELSDPTSDVDEAARGVPPDYPGSGRTYVLLVDSLRDKTAANAELMPNLARLAAEGAHARVDTVYDAITAPAVRAGFTGRSHFRVLGFVQNFVRRSSGIGSLFSQLRDAGGESIVYSENKTFAQFGKDVAREYPNETGEGDEVQRENAQARHALELFRSGKSRLTVFHLLYLDHVAHQYGIAHSEYRQDVASLDALIGEIASAIDPDDTLVVLGDHGHTETGRHALGLEVPTYIAVRGPGFKAGVDLGRIHITSYRYLLSWALKLPLAADYTRGRHPEALSAPGGIPAGFAVAPLQKEAEPEQRLTLGVAALLATAVGVSFGLWWTFGLMIHAGRVAAVTVPSALKTVLIAASCAVPVMAIGVLLAKLRSDVHEPYYPTIMRQWMYLLAVMLVLVRRIDLGKLSLVVLGVPFLFLWPTAYRYGSTAVFAPAWFCWATCGLVLSFGFRDGLPTAKYLSLGKRWKVRRSVLLYLGIVFLIQPFFFTDATNFVFTGFKALSPELAPTALWAQALTGILASLILFYRRQDGRRGLVFASLFAAYFLAVFFHAFPEGARGNFFLGVLLIILAFAGRRERLARSFYLAGLCVLYFYFVRVTSETRLHAMMLFAAIRLSVLMLDHLPMARRNVRLNALFLQVVGLIVAGWVTLSWGLDRLEWYAAYDFFPPRLVEEYVGFFLPFIVLKYALPVLVSRVLIAEHVAREREYPAKEVALFAGLKFATLTLLTLGIGYYTVGSGVYLEATGELAIFLSLAGGLF